jgi:D-glycero-D-manno-heptose 1,7-bisphosphate phosphatase
MLKNAGFTIAICTNQSAIGRGNLSLAEYDAIHHLMQEALATAGGHIDKIYCAPDPPEEATDRRKPGPGMLREALQEFHAEAAHTYFVGDMLRDAQAAHHAGCPFILVRTGKGEKTVAEGIPDQFKPVTICDDLYAAARYVIERAGV